jgi:xanthine/CO dehydrogenase XdhC/CoxF family maturation factor
VDGTPYGSISGGCLESDLILTAWDRTEQGPVVAEFDTNTEEAWGYGLGCRGIISVLIRRVEPDDAELSWLKAHLHGRQVSTWATHLDGDGIGKPVCGQDLLALLSDLLEDDVECGQVRVDGNAYFVESLAPRTALRLFGAGFDALPLVRNADELGWHSTVYDHRPSLIRSDKFPTADRLVCARFESLELASDPYAAAVVMTHNYEQDRTALEHLLKLELAYIGVLGPRARTERLLDDIGQPFRLRDLHSPVGLDIGAESPNEIALAICAEIQAVVRNRDAGFLRNRSRSIHETVSVRH